MKNAVKEIRNLVASVIADEKSYNVPTLCVRLGLADGDESEAFQSKYKYAITRLSAIDDKAVIKIARILSTEHNNYYLTECIHKIDALKDPEVSELTRRSLVKFLCGYGLTNEQTDFDLIAKVWPIFSMHPCDASSSEANLGDQIYRHYVTFSDWSLQELLINMGILDCSNSRLFALIAATVSPLFADEARQKLFVAEICEILNPDGYCLKPTKSMSGRTQYGVCLLGTSPPSDDAISNVLRSFDVDTIHERWEAALERRNEDPRGAITLARTLLEDVCRWILSEADAEHSQKDDLPKLYRKLAKKLKLAPDMHSEEVFKQILGSAQQIVEGLGALRNKLGDAHSQGPLKARPKTRHAELAVNLAGAMATFLISTWEDQKSSQELE